MEGLLAAAPEGRHIDEKRRTQDIWKKRAGYCRRWLVEIIFSAFKYMLDERPHLPKWKSMVQEVKIKVATYNKLIDIGAAIA